MNNKIESLKEELKYMPGLNNGKVDMMLKLTDELRYIDTQEAREYCNKAFSLAKDLNYRNGQVTCQLYLNILNYIDNVQNKNIEDELLAYIEKFENNSESERSYILAMLYLAQVYDDQGNYESAIKYLSHILNLSETRNELPDLKGDALFYLGVIYSRLKKNDEAIEYYLKSAEIRHQLNNEPALAVSLNNLARLHADIQEFDKAIELYNQVLSIREKNEDISIVYTFIGIGNVYEKKEEFKQAISYFKKSLKLSLNLTGFERALFLANMGTGRCLDKLDKNEDALEYLHEALKSALSLNSAPMILQCYEILADLYEKTGDLLQEIKYLKSFYQLKYSTDKEDQNRVKNIELEKLAHDLEEKNRHMSKGISYAKKIQEALLQSEYQISQFLNQYFILYRAKDNISGDFYYIDQVDDHIVIAAADCTGHGVPGALMSMLGISFLKDIIHKENTISPDGILNSVSRRVKETFRQDNRCDNVVKSGMDLALCVLDIPTMKVEIAGFNNPVFLIRNGQLKEIKLDKLPPGMNISEIENFRKEKQDILINDVFYLFSDGFQDQKGGPNKKKYMKGRFKDFLLSVHKDDMEEQKRKINQEIEEWIHHPDCEYFKKNRQIDDILIIGFRVSPYQLIMALDFNVSKCIHLLKHFRKLNEESFNRAVHEYNLQPSFVNEQMLKPGSKYFHEFALDPDDLWKKCCEWIKLHEPYVFYEGEKIIMRLDFPKSVYEQGIGEYCIMEINDIPQEEKENLSSFNYADYMVKTIKMPPVATWELHLIIGRNADNRYTVYTIFPGKYAPNFPNQDLQTYREYMVSKTFWDNHVLLV